MSLPSNLKIYHIVHVDRLSSIIEGSIWKKSTGTRCGREIGSAARKRSRLNFWLNAIFLGH